MTITVDFSGLQELFYLPLHIMVWRVFWWYFGWMPMAIVMLWGLIQIWVRKRRIAWDKKQKFILLAIDVPRNNAQSPRAVENMFIYFAGAHSTLNLIEQWWEGKFQLGFSFEIVSIDGFIQFLIRTPVQFRHLVETAVYSQYPDAEIYEVEDYVGVAPDHYPDDEYDIWGAEFIQVKNQVLPIRTYEQFEHKFGDPELHYKDPMASLMDLMSSLQKGEQLWYQIILIPIGEEWKKEKDAFIAKMLGEKAKPTKANNFIDKILAWMGDASEQVYQLWGEIEDKKKKEAEMFKMWNLKPMEKAMIEGAEKKATKLGFEVSIRGIYVSRKEVMNKPKAVNGFVGFIKQFNTGDLNALKPDTKVTMTSTAYMFADERLNAKKRKIIHAYKERSEMLGRKPWVLNVEELATIWHFPIDAVVKAPLIQRAGARRVEPPMALPFDEGVKKAAASREPIFDEAFEVEEKETEAPAEEPLDRPRREPDFMEEVSEESAESNTESEPTDRGRPPSNLPFAD